MQRPTDPWALKAFPGGSQELNALGGHPQFHLHPTSSSESFQTKMFIGLFFWGCFFLSPQGSTGSIPALTPAN